MTKFFRQFQRPSFPPNLSQIIQRCWQYLVLGFLVTLLILLTGTPGFSTEGTSIVQSSPPLSRLIGDMPQLVEAGKTYYQNGQFAAAIASWQKAEAQLAQQGDKLNQAGVLSNLALAYQQLGQWAEANQSIATSVSLLQNQSAQTANRSALLAQALNIQAGLQLAQGKADLAVETWNSAIALYQQLGDQPGLIRCQINQSKAFRSLGMYLRAQEILEQVNRSLTTQPDSPLKVAGLLNFGDALRLVGNWQQAETVLQQSLELATTLHLPQEIATAQLSLGNTAYAQQQTEKAVDYYQQAAAIAPTPVMKVQAQLNQFRVLADLQQWSEARALLTQIQPQVAQLPLTRLTVYARIRFAQSWMQLQSAGVIPSGSTEAGGMLTDAVRQAKELADSRLESYALGYLGASYEQSQQWAEAQRLTESALALAQMNNAVDIAYRWQWQLGRLLKVQGQREPAIVAYRDAVTGLKAIRHDLAASGFETQFSFRQSVEPVYRQLVSLLLEPTGGAIRQSDRVEEARDVIESLQLAELDDFFREACLSGLRKQIDTIDSHAAIIYPIILPERLEVILSMPRQPLRHYTANITQPELEKLISATRQSLRRTSLEKERLPLAQKVYNLLIRPWEADLKQSHIQTLTFVLDGALKSLPMAALYDGQHYLVEKYGLALTPGLQLLGPHALKQRQLQVLIAGLSEERAGFIALPGVKVEVDNIHSELTSQLLLNQSFTRKALRQKVDATPFSVVHLATHGQFGSRAEETFVLTWDSQVDVKELGSLLRARGDLMQEPIELLVLSACQTASGDERAALGLAGVAIRSGARATLATLWSVDDASTSALMVQFYRELKQANLTKAEALRQAQLALLKQPRFNHPYYWAPFVLLGNWL
ncbi:MAG: CHAT domain-containing protein [Scytolyngbya sp. HA4215-MV1]|jgi:CHAT domain-containing protein/tetratricopeptide (TPR) repeat protein|nr:CHAT domain-containing protein [Scytolyngbya sp. HA4215-MV1]